VKAGIVSALAVLSFFLLIAGGCGGGGKGTAAQPAAPPVTTAVVTLNTKGTLPPGSTIGGIDVVLNLPPGVTAKADKTGATQAGVVVPSGVAQGAISVAKFTPGEGAAAGQVRIAIIKTDGFGAGEFVRVKLDVNGSPPRESDFSTAGLSVTDINGATISGLTATPSLQIR
jgi:hypothetical protein